MADGGGSTLVLDLCPRPGRGAPASAGASKHMCCFHLRARGRSRTVPAGRPPGRLAVGFRPSSSDRGEWLLRSPCINARGCRGCGPPRVSPLSLAGASEPQVSRSGAHPWGVGVAALCPQEARKILSGCVRPNRVFLAGRRGVSTEMAHSEGSRGQGDGADGAEGPQGGREGGAAPGLSLECWGSARSGDTEGGFSRVPPPPAHSLLRPPSSGSEEFCPVADLGAAGEAPGSCPRSLSA